MKTIVQKLGKSCRRWLLALSLAWVGIGMANADATFVSGSTSSSAGGWWENSCPNDAGHSSYTYSTQNGYMTFTTTAATGYHVMAHRWADLGVNNYNYIVIRAKLVSGSNVAISYGTQDCTPSAPAAEYQSVTSTNYVDYVFTNTKAFNQHLDVWMTSSSGATIYIEEIYATNNPPSSGPSAPTNLTATANGNAINLSWNALADAAGYTIYRSNSENGTYTNIGTTTMQPRKS